MKILKISVDLSDGTYTTSLMGTFGIVPTEQLAMIDSNVEDVLPTLDYGDEDSQECEGYAEITFKLEFNSGDGVGWTWNLIDSFYHPLV